MPIPASSPLAITSATSALQSQRRDTTPTWSRRGDQSQSGAFPGFESPQPSYRGSIRDQRSGRGEWVSAQEPNQTTLWSSTIADNLGIWLDPPISSKEPSIC